jgi:hypothetical protein
VVSWGPSIEDVRSPRTKEGRTTTTGKSAEKNGTGGALTYKTVDLRDELPGEPDSNIDALERDRKGSVPEKKPGRFVVHYSGPDFEGIDLYDQLRHGQATILEVLTSEANGHMAPGRFDPEFRPNGLQYHYTIWEDTVYVCRDEDALLWHCGDGIGDDSSCGSSTRRWWRDGRAIT